jgi:putative endonuclease
LGDRGERQAARFLRRHGVRIIARQYRNRFGEIDLIGRDGDALIFVEVKTRSGDSAGHPTEAVTTEKQRGISRTALAYLKRRRLLDHPMRFDVIAVIWPPGSRRPEITWYKNAFPAVGVDW